MSGRNMRVKVRTADLLDAVKARRTVIVKKHDSDVASYDARLLAHKAKVAKTLRDAADKLDKGGALPEFVRYGFRNISAAPSKPSITSNLAKIDRTIRTLEIAADDAITISADDYAEFLA